MQKIPRTIAILILFLGLSVGTTRALEQPQVNAAIDWQGFLQRHDLLWSRMPKVWHEAPFLGNGMMGAMIMQADNHTVRWEVGRGDVQDHRPADRKFGYDTCRLPIGQFELKTVGKITGGTMRLDLWNAEASGEIQTDKGSIQWRSFAHAEQMAILTELEPSAGEQGCRWQWKALPAISPRQAFGKKKPGYKPNPPSYLEKDGDINLCIQPLLSGGETVTAWREETAEHRSLLQVSVAHSFPEASSRKEAIDELRSVAQSSLNELLQSHREWWHAYYPDSFISISDAYWESFYWIQIYKLASTTRADRMLIDNQGPWLQTTPWPGAWWNLNVQLSYWPTYTSNRHHLSKSLERTLYDNVETLINNVPEAYRSDSAGIPRATGQHCKGPVAAPNGKNQPEIGLLLWACHNSWLHYRHTMDDEALRNELLPLLKRAVNYHLHFLSEGEDGKLHLPPTFSPEYGGSGPDCNFDLALLRWGCAALIDASNRLGIDDPLLPRWKEVVADLAAYPTDENGYMIARDAPFVRGHRHYSHLLMLYPLYLENTDKPGAEELMLTSLRHWQSMGARQGYSLTGAASISSAFGRGNDALMYLNGLVEFLQPNTLYKESGPVIETPLSGAQSIHDMIIQSWGGTIRVFPALPDAWDDVAFHDLSTEGAFLVSAKRKEGKTEFVRIKSLAGEPCILMPELEGVLQVTGSREFQLKEIKARLYSLDLRKGEEAILWSGDQVPDLTLLPVAIAENQWNSFGLKRP